MQENKNIELQNAIEKIISDEGLTVFTDDYLTGDSVKVFSELERLSLIRFSVAEMQSGDDYYIQADYFNENIKKAIILNYDFQDYFHNIEEMIEVIKDTEKEIDEFNRMTSRTLSKDMIDEIDTLVEYLYENGEQEHYEEEDKPEGHIFESVRKVEDYLAKIKDVEIITVEDTEAKERTAITITVFKSESEEGYMYDIYDVEPSEIDGIDSVDGGICTSNIINALGMAYSQAIDYLKK